MSTRKIGPVLATFVVANNMIGSGFFLLPASLAASGAVTVFSWIAGTVLALVLGGAFARLARDYPDLSSADDYVRPSQGRDASFLASTLYWVSSWIGNNAIAVAARSEEHTSELQSLMRTSYAVFCLKKKKTNHT